jgi:hypothetical protein
MPAIVPSFFDGLRIQFVPTGALVFLGGAPVPAQQTSNFPLVNIADRDVDVAASTAVSKLASLFRQGIAFTQAVGQMAGVASAILLAFYAHTKLTFR